MADIKIPGWVCGSTHPKSQTPRKLGQEDLSSLGNIQKGCVCEQLSVDCVSSVYKAVGSVHTQQTSKALPASPAL